MEKKEARGGKRDGSGTKTADGEYGMIRTNISIPEDTRKWLASQPGGISVTIRRLVKEARSAETK